MNRKRQPTSFVQSFLTGASRVARDLLEAKLVPSRLEGFAQRLSAYGGYEAARPSRLRDSWTTSNPGPNAAVDSASANLVARSRDLERNDAHWARWLEVDTDEVVGTGLVPRAVEVADDDSVEPRPRTELEREADAAWAWWSARGVADIEGQHTLDAKTSLMNRGWKRDGACYMRRIWLPPTPERIVPIKVQILERDMVDETKNAVLADGGEDKRGIRVDASGRVVGYWFRKRHPGDQGWHVSADSVLVPEADVIHLFKPTRAGQLEGVPHGAPSMVRKRDLSQYEGSELTRKDSESRAVAIVTPPPLADAMSSTEFDERTQTYIGITPNVVDVNGQRVGSIEPGSVLAAPDGGSVAFHQPGGSPGYPEYKKANLREISSGLNIPYEDLSGDLEGVNYTSYRAGHIKRNAHVDNDQWLWFIPTVMDRLWEWCMEAAWLTGNVSSPDVPVQWSTPVRISVDPEKDTLADIIEERAGYAHHDDKLGARGHNPAVFYQRKARENAQRDRFGLTFDTDSVKMAFRGAFAQTVQGTLLDEAKNKGGLGVLATILAAIEAEAPGTLARLAEAHQQRAAFEPAKAE